MRLDKLTIKLQEALQEAISFATESGHQQGIALEVSEKAKNYLIDKGFDVNFGARPLKRTIQKYIQDPLSLKLLEGSLKEGSKVAVDLDANKNLIFRFQISG